MRKTKKSTRRAKRLKAPKTDLASIGLLVGGLYLAGSLLGNK